MPTLTMTVTCEKGELSAADLAGVIEDVLVDQARAREQRDDEDGPDLAVLAVEEGLTGLGPFDLQVSVRDTRQGLADVESAIVVAIVAKVAGDFVGHRVEALWARGVKELVRRRRGRRAIGDDLAVVVTIDPVLELDLERAAAVDAGHDEVDLGSGERVDLQVAGEGPHDPAEGS